MAMRGVAAVALVVLYKVVLFFLDKPIALSSAQAVQLLPVVDLARFPVRA